MKDLRRRHAEHGSIARLEAPNLAWPVSAIPEPAGPPLSLRDGALRSSRSRERGL